MDDSFEFPEEIIQQVLTQFKSQPLTAQSPVRQLLARLVFDSFAPRHFAEIRADTAIGDDVAGRQMLFRAEEYDIDLKCEQSSDYEVEVMFGQIVPQSERRPDMNDLTVALMQGDAIINRVRTDSRGNFRFERIISGNYDLKIQVPEGEINIHDVVTTRASQEK